MIKAAVAGATGYAGAELVRILAGHPDVELVLLTSNRYAGVAFSEVYPAMAGIVDRVCETLTAERLCAEADVVFTALPHQTPMQIVPALIAGGVRVVDLSADFRFQDPEVYEAAYQPHSAGDLLDQAVYGLSEVYSAALRQAALVGNPGCYPTSVLLPLIPLIRAGLITTDNLIADSKSGVSGAGRSPATITHFCEVTESFRPYKVAVHRHNPEMEAVLSREAGTAVPLVFVPHLIPMSRGMLTTLYATPAGDLRQQDVTECLQAFYRGRPFVRLCPPGRAPDTRNVRGTNYCDIGIKLDSQRGRLILMSAIDNLVKGAAGQAVQNMNLVFGLDERRGLTNIPYPL
jgi:N-acetyl-gamma-glutamyl-phosphate reductase